MTSSSQRTAVIASIQTYSLIGNKTFIKKTESKSIGTPISNAGNYQTEANILLAGSMMITLSLLIVGLCFFLHRKFKSNLRTVSLHTLPWTDENLEIYTLSGQEEITGIYLPPTPSPPPTYETVVKMCKKDEDTSKKIQDSFHPEVRKIVPQDDDLPTYDAAIQLRGDNYI